MEILLNKMRQNDSFSWFLCVTSKTSNIVTKNMYLLFMLNDFKDAIDFAVNIV